MWKYLLGGYAAIGVGFTLWDLHEQKARLSDMVANDAAHGVHDALYRAPKANLSLTIGWLPMVLIGVAMGPK